MIGPHDKPRWNVLRWWSLLTLGQLLAGMAAAGDMSVANLRMEAVDPTNDLSVSFALRWTNSWRASWRDGERTLENWDAAWVFAKYLGRDERWHHAAVAQAETGAGDFVAEVSGDQMGAFIHGIKAYQGKASLDSVKLKLDVSKAGLKDSAKPAVKVYALEMVLIPEGPFLLGDGPRPTSAFFRYPSPTNPYPVKSESPIAMGESEGNLFFQPSHYSGTASGTIPAAYPKGFGGYYVMKHLLNWGQYVAMLNTLKPARAAERFPLGSNGFDHIIQGFPPDCAAPESSKSCSMLRWSDGVAFADWAALRPLTELEWEKAWRGSWVTTTIKQEIQTLDMDGEGLTSGSEQKEDPRLPPLNERKPEAGYWVDFIWGPFRSQPPEGRDSTTYYGVVDGGGGILELCVTVGNERGRAFKGTHGDGELADSGDANVPDWPGPDGVGSGYRGGRWQFRSPSLRATDRSVAEISHAGRLHGELGWRAARSAPR